MSGRPRHWLLAGVLLAAMAGPSPALADAVGLGGVGVPGIQSLHTYQDPALLDKAWKLPVAARYKPHIEYQHNLTFCGPTTLANVQHSLGQTTDQTQVLEGTGVMTVLGRLPLGLTLDELAGIARQKLGREVRVIRGLDLASLREHLKASNDPKRRYVVNFSRGPLFGTGGGHHSPIAAYLVEEDLVLVLDVNEAFGPWLVQSARLLEAMNTVDATAGKLRGLMLIE